ncbi:hypothetical protein BJG93_26190 [Paraburkholderia sprentiae WSM5005]|uniref:Uncharacterized protein n=1 Tax=Paraburkholderia sprentiae WSM5005 TaxID=754502 RepID=A0A1I9YRH5_9BURK|nr:hypothetical protein [Paraburkholderia sprentiae]APA88790.1 hypothetical protein BJG93_26190 [Paraburkholderia sprentiae WSM5005]
MSYQQDPDGVRVVLAAMKASADMANISVFRSTTAVPFGFAGSLEAARAACIAMSEINLNMHEAKTPRGGADIHL